MKHKLGQILSGALALAALTAWAGAQGRRGFVNPAEANAGEQVFVTNCSFCHGADAHGGAEGGPDLTHSAVITDDPSGTQLTTVLKTGRPPRMPSFQLTPEQITQVMAFLQRQIMAARQADAEKAILVGNAQAGEAYFNGPGGCTSCHSVTGDLKGIGAKYPPTELQGRMMLTRGNGGYPGGPPGKPGGADELYRKATITPPTGPAVTGDIVYISDFDITVIDSSGARHTFTRNGDVPKVVVTDPLQTHLDMLGKLSETDMHNLTAYLVTLK